MWPGTVLWVVHAQLLPHRPVVCGWVICMHIHLPVKIPYLASCRNSCKAEPSLETASESMVEDCVYISWDKSQWRKQTKRGNFLLQHQEHENNIIQTSLQHSLITMPPSCLNASHTLHTMLRWKNTVHVLSAGP